MTSAAALLLFVFSFVYLIYALLDPEKF